MVDPHVLFDLLQRLVVELDAHGIEYAVAGGLAVSAWVEPRATTDIDVLVAVEADDAPALAKELASKLGGFASTGVVRFKSGAVFQRLIVETAGGEVLVDLMLPSDPGFRDVIARRVRIELPYTGRPAWCATAEDLILMKLRAWRPQDRADIMKLAVLDDLDVDYVETQVAALGLADRWRRALALADEE